MLPERPISAERKYALTKITAGDYLLPSNDAQTIYRIRRYTDGPSFGLDDWSSDRELWNVARWAGEVGPGCFVDTSSESGRWEEIADNFATRREAIERALTGWTRHDIERWGAGWRDWQPGDAVESTVGMRGEVVKVNVAQHGQSRGMSWVRVRWENGTEGRITPTKVRRVSDA